MSFISVNMADAEEQAPVDAGSHDLVVSYVEEKDSKSSGKPMILVGHEIEGHPEASMVYQTLSLPTEDDEDKTRKFKILMLRRYLTMAGANFDLEEGFDSETLYGLQFTAYLNKDEIDKGEDANPDAPPEFRNSIDVPKLAV